MAISTGRPRKGPRSEINMTPLVDVALVLLIIFLVVVPIQNRHIPVEVPPELPPGAISGLATPLVLVGRMDGTVDVDDGTGRSRSVSRVDLARTIRPLIDAMRTERVVFVDFDSSLAYAEVVSIMDTVKGMGRDAAGHEANPVRVALRTTSPEEAARRRSP